MSSERAAARAARLAVVGATGVAGRALAAALRGLAPSAPLRLVGRDRAQLDALAAQLGGPVDVALAEVGDRASLQRAFAGCAVVASAAGPFAPLGDHAVHAAIASGCHYLDLCAEQAVIRRVFERCDAAARHGKVAVVPGAGFSVTAGDLLAAAAASALLGHDDPGPTVRDAPGPRLTSAQPLAVAIGYLFDDLTLSPGAQSSVFANLHAPMVAWRRDRWDAERPGWRRKTFHPGAMAELAPLETSASGTGQMAAMTDPDAAAIEGEGAGAEQSAVPPDAEATALEGAAAQTAQTAQTGGADAEPPPVVPTIVLSREAFSLGGGDNITIPRHIAAHAVDTYVSLSRNPSFTRALRLAAFAASWLPAQAASVLVPSRTSADEYRATRFTVVAVVEHAFDRRQLVAHGKDLYATSSAITARLALALLHRPAAAPVGVLAPAEIVRARPFLDELAQAGLLTLS